MEDNKRPRIPLLEDLKIEFVDKRRKRFIEDLGTFSQSADSHLIDEPTVPLSPTSDLFSILKDDSEADNFVHLSRDIKANISEILAFPEFVTCLDSLISEEASLISKSLFFVRPEGSRMLIYIKNYLATVYNKHGFVTSTFECNFKGPTILDSILYRDKLNSSNDGDGENTYFLLDILMLNGCMIAKSELDCRLFFLNSIVEELTLACNVLFKFVKYQDFDPNQLRLTYESIMLQQFEHETDSIIFVNKNSVYVGGYNPNWLCFRDKNLSKYSKCDDVICKVYNLENHLYTLDKVLIGELNEPFQHKIIRIKVEEMEDLRLKFKVVGQAKGHKSADSLRKIYVSFLNQKGTNDNFNKLVDYLQNLLITFLHK